MGPNTVCLCAVTLLESCSAVFLGHLAHLHVFCHTRRLLNTSRFSSYLRPDLFIDFNQNHTVQQRRRVRTFPLWPNFNEICKTMPVFSLNFVLLLFSLDFTLEYISGFLSFKFVIPFTSLRAEVCCSAQVEVRGQPKGGFSPSCGLKLRLVSWAVLLQI